jgi:hypothetical protein
MMVFLGYEVAKKPRYPKERQGWVVASVQHGMLTPVPMPGAGHGFDAPGHAELSRNVAADRGSR